jgi:para-aminobenzoate synthetase / 4-amino-4-deoxychorismate lyase
MIVSIQFEKNPILFSDPLEMVCCHDPSELPDAFHEMERLLKSGHHLAGFLSYEAGYCFEEKLSGTKTGFPLLLMGAFRNPEPCRPGRPGRGEKGRFAITDLRINISKDDYSSRIERIREFIARGDVYQITYCIKLHFGFSGDPRSLFSELLKSQPVPYPAYIETEKFQVLSLSPERFMKKKAHQVTTEPMKGTWPRGSNVFSDALAHVRFSRDIKNRAENLMITDLLRNDLGRIGKRISVPRLFTITKYRTLFQMTSTVTGEVPRHRPLYDFFAALFPSGSVTGAPKIRAMEIIRDLEKEDRKIYTGAIGHITPRRDFYFNIPIRTLLLQDGQGEMGIGGGIVWDSTPQGEWDEGLLKARFLTDIAAAGKPNAKFKI